MCSYPTTPTSTTPGAHSPATPRCGPSAAATSPRSQEKAAKFPTACGRTWPQHRQPRQGCHRQRLLPRQTTPAPRRHRLGHPGHQRLGCAPGTWTRGRLPSAWTYSTVGTPDLAGLAFRREARRKWNRFLTRQLSWTTTPPDEKIAFTWDQFVVMWQVIGRLVRGGVEARVVFVDAAFSPREAGLHAVDTSDTSLLVSMRSILDWTDRPDFCGDLIFCLTLLPGVAHLPCQKASSNSSGGRSPHQECNRLAVYLGWDSMLPTIGRRRPDTSNLASTCTCVCAQTSGGCFRLR
jgi:hypothetical protein